MRLIGVSVLTVGALTLALGACSSNQSTNPSPGGDSQSPSASTSPVPPSVISQSGTGDKLLDVPGFGGLATVTFTCDHTPGVTSYESLPAVGAIGAGGKSVGIIYDATNHGGGDSLPFKGTVLVNPTANNDTVLRSPVTGYQIQCPGPWTLKQAPAASLPAVSQGQATNGDAANVLRIPLPPDSGSRAHFTARGESNITLKAIFAEGESPDSLVNAIAKYDSDIVVPTGANYLTINVAPGTKWSLTLK